ncbi:MAG TPA: xylose isomerase, partial [Sphaerochaeta sp.]|nr:xylose isomerase [Sphaerochaeta sp.]
GHGGLNFDAKRRRGSIDNEDLFIAHIGGMDSFAFGLEVASKIIEDKVLSSFVAERYASFDTGEGKKFAQGSMDLSSLAQYGRTASIMNKSGKQEQLQNLLNSYILGAK